MEICRPLSKRERLNPFPNEGEILLGYKRIAPFDDGIDHEGLTKEENGPLIIIKLNLLQKHLYLRALTQKDRKPVAPAFLVPAYLCGCGPTSSWSGGYEYTVRTFRADFTDVYEKRHWWSCARLVRKDWLSLFPDVEFRSGPRDTILKSILAYWEGLDQRIISSLEIKELFGESPKNKAA